MTSKTNDGFSDYARIDEELRLPAGTRIYLDVIGGPDIGRRFEFGKGNVVIGRKLELLRPEESGKREPDIALTDSDVEPRHALIEVLAPGKIFIKDLASATGIFIDGVRLASFGQVRPGNEVHLGRTSFEIRIEQRK